MNIILCNTTDTGGGAAAAVCRLLDGLLKKGINVRMLVLSKESQSPYILSVDDVLQEGFILKLFQKFRRKLSYYYTSFRWHQYPNKRNIALHDIYISYLGNSLDRIKFDILHLNWIEGGFINFRELQKIKKPVVWTIHGSLPFTGICHHLLCDKYKTQCRNCPALGSDKNNDFSTENFELKRKRYNKLDLYIVSPSRFMANRALESTLLKNRPIKVIPNGINTEIFHPTDKKTARKLLKIHNKTTLLFGAINATTDENKGFQLLLDGLNKLQNYFEQGEIQILIFGGDFNGETFFEIVNLGHIKSEELLSTVYSSADVMVVPSKHENLSYTILESLACGTPVSAFDVGGNSEMIDHKQNGYLSKPFSDSDLAYGIIWCLENNKDGILSKNARNKVLKQFTLEKISKQYIDLYKSLLEN